MLTKTAPLFLCALTLSMAGCDWITGGDDDDDDDGLFQDCTVTAIQIGNSVNGSLATSDCQLIYEGVQLGEFVDYYEFTITSTRTITMNMTSSPIDTYLIVWNRATGEIVAEDDDGGSGLNARIVQSFSAGTYVIGATSFAAGETGTYTLSTN